MRQGFATVLSTLGLRAVFAITFGFMSELELKDHMCRYAPDACRSIASYMSESLGMLPSTLVRSPVV